MLRSLCCYVVYITTVDTPYILLSNFALAFHNRILESLWFTCFSLHDTKFMRLYSAIFGIFIENFISNSMKTSTNKSQNLFSWNKAHKGLNSVGSGYESNVPNYLRTNFSLQRLKVFVSKLTIGMCAFQGQKFEVFSLFRLNLV